ncbi:MAG: hypothetical protein J6D26_09210 [Clostridia bacterium]|nr:hypothetical protein [Clostridia bacterium]
MDNKAILDKYIEKAKAIADSLAPLTKTDDIYADVRALVLDMQEAALNTDDEMLHPILYNSAATIATAPESCSVRQLSEAFSEAVAEMEMMKEYL